MERRDHADLRPGGEDEPVRFLVARVHLRLLEEVAGGGVSRFRICRTCWSASGAIPASSTSSGRTSPRFEDHLERRFTFLGVVYWRRAAGVLSRAVPQPERRRRNRLRRGPRLHPASASGVSADTIPGVQAATSPSAASPGIFPTLPPDTPTTPPDPNARAVWGVGRQHVPTGWTLVNQNWTAQLVPVTMANLPMILTTTPPVSGFDFRLPGRERAVGGRDSAD